MSEHISHTAAWNAAQWIKQHVSPQAQLTCDSRAVRAGDVFIAYPGHTADGRQYVLQAIKQGAAAIVYEADQAPAALTALTVPALAVEQLKKHAGVMAAKFYDQPSLQMRVVGITGTSGKSSVALWVAQALHAMGERSAVIGTLGAGEIRADMHLQEFGNTTPDAVFLQRTLAGLRDQGVTHVAMEVTSIGLVDHRLNGVEFAVGAFTNLTRDHLDYHGTFEAYEQAKALLFTRAELKHAVINLDDAAGVRMTAVAQAYGMQVLGTSMQQHANAGLTLNHWQVSAQGITGQLGGVTQATLHSPMMGQFNAENLLIVLGCLLQLGFAAQASVQALIQLPPVPGRMQRVSVHTPEPAVLVDYAHKPDALEKALATCQPLAHQQGGKLVAVFGCGGDRDRGKRPIMGGIAARLADRVVITSDNPRTESPEAIVQEIAAGVPAGTDLLIEVDRARAIANSIAAARANDVIVIAGKGHESYQIIGRDTIDFSDQEHAHAALQRWHAHQPSISAQVSS